MRERPPDVSADLVPFTVGERAYICMLHLLYWCQQIWFLSPSASGERPRANSIYRVSADLVPFTVGETNHLYTPYSTGGVSRSGSFHRRRVGTRLHVIRDWCVSADLVPFTVGEQVWSDREGAVSLCQQIWFLSPSARATSFCSDDEHTQVSADLVPFTVGEPSMRCSIIIVCRVSRSGSFHRRRVMSSLQKGVSPLGVSRSGSFHRRREGGKKMPELFLLCQQIWFLSPSARYRLLSLYAPTDVSADLVPFTVGEQRGMRK